MCGYNGCLMVTNANTILYIDERRESQEIIYPFWPHRVWVVIIDNSVSYPESAVATPIYVAKTAIRTMYIRCVVVLCILDYARRVNMILGQCTSHNGTYNLARCIITQIICTSCRDERYVAIGII